MYIIEIILAEFSKTLHTTYHQRPLEPIVPNRKYDILRQYVFVLCI